MQAYILIQTEVGKAVPVVDATSRLEGVVTSELLTGGYDVITRVEAEDVDELGRIVLARIQAVDGITRTVTCPVVHV